MSASQMVASNAIAGAANALTGMSGSSGHAEGTTSSAISGGNLIIRDKESQKQDIAGPSRDPEKRQRQHLHRYLTRRKNRSVCRKRRLSARLAVR